LLRGWLKPLAHYLAALHGVLRHQIDLLEASIALATYTAACDAGNRPRPWRRFKGVFRTATISRLAWAMAA